MAGRACREENFQKEPPQEVCPKRDTQTGPRRPDRLACNRGISRPTYSGRTALGQKRNARSAQGTIPDGQTGRAEGVAG